MTQRAVRQATTTHKTTIAPHKNKTEAMVWNRHAAIRTDLCQLSRATPAWPEISLCHQFSVPALAASIIALLA